MKKTLMALCVTGILFSCSPPPSKMIIIKAPIDSLITNWCNSWNNHDSIGVVNLFASDALLSDDNLIAMHIEEISTKWIHPNIHVVNNLIASKMQDWSTIDNAGYMGKYELNVVVNDSIIAQPKGVFMVNWQKNDKGEWKVTTANMHSFFSHK